ncbi:DNA mismatch repair protein [uncultured Ruminococcus sp.]|uniref:MutS-related protein n=1 Tax=uncultured Ruminococcus sp. TaxID=165186 RepID=UPI0025E139D6|nr:DNA mismatch repair protein [uncultured Ruminococcus sp.]
MDQKTGFSLLQPFGMDIEYRRIPDHVMHDLGLDKFCQEISSDGKERRLVANVLSQISDDPKVAAYRQHIFGDIFRSPELRKTMLELFDKIQFMRDFSTMHKTSDEELGLWHLFHRLDELDSYIKTVETMRDRLSDERIQSEGLISLRDYITELYEDACFAEMKKDIAALKMKASDVQSVTLGINVNERFEAVSIGLVSVNKKPFKRSGIVSNFADAIANKERIQDTSDWDGDLHYQLIDREEKRGIIDHMKNEAGLLAVRSSFATDARAKSTIVNAMADGAMENSTFYLDTVVNKMLSSLVKKLRDILTKYANVAIVNISGLVPEFIYYIRCAELIGGLTEKGCVFSEAQPVAEGETSMQAKGFYDLKLAMNMENVSEIVPNDLCFDQKHTVYILTGANRGGKTTITQAVGQLFILAQGGLFVPAESFRYVPCDCIYTHFPADEDKTMDLGRLGEECVRFKEMFSRSTNKSLILLNETFSTTSFEEGYYIAKDSVKALLAKGVRTIYNTHMHKLGYDAEELTREIGGTGAASLVMQTEEGKRSFKVALAKPEGSSYAKDIAKKYGVTYDMLVGGSGS